MLLNDELMARVYISTYNLRKMTISKYYYLKLNKPITTDKRELNLHYNDLYYNNFLGVLIRRDNVSFVRNRILY